MTTALQHWRTAPTHRVRLAHGELTYRRFGHGPAVILVHGWPLSGVTYRGLVQELEGEFTCYVPDLPGAGQSPANDDLKELLAGFGELIVEFADTLNLETFALVGQDSGGTIARLAAARAGGRVTAMALTNTETPGHIPVLLRAFQVAAGLPGATSIFQWLLRSHRFRRSMLGFGGCFEDQRLLEGEFDETVFTPLCQDISNALWSLRKADLSVIHSLADVHANIHAPLLCVWGDKDPFFSVAGAHKIIEQWAGPALLELLPGKRLLVHEEAPQRVGSLIRAHFAQHVPVAAKHSASA